MPIRAWDKLATRVEDSSLKILHPVVVRGVDWYPEPLVDISAAEVAGQANAVDGNPKDPTQPKLLPGTLSDLDGQLPRSPGGMVLMSHPLAGALSLAITAASVLSPDSCSITGWASPWRISSPAFCPLAMPRRRRFWYLANLLALWVAPAVAGVGDLGAFIDVLKNPAAAVQCMKANTISRAWLYVQALRKARAGDATDTGWTMSPSDAANSLTLAQAIDHELTQTALAIAAMPEDAGASAAGGGTLLGWLDEAAEKVGPAVRKAADLVANWWADSQKLGIVPQGMGWPDRDPDRNAPPKDIPRDFVDTRLPGSLDYTKGITISHNYNGIDVGRLSFRVVEDSVKGDWMEITGCDVALGVEELTGEMMTRYLVALTMVTDALQRCLEKYPELKRVSVSELLLRNKSLLASALERLQEEGDLEIRAVWTHDGCGGDGGRGRRRHVFRHHGTVPG